MYYEKPEAVREKYKTMPLKEEKGETATRGRDQINVGRRNSEW